MYWPYFHCIYLLCYQDIKKNGRQRRKNIDAKRLRDNWSNVFPGLHCISSVSAGGSNKPKPPNINNHQPPTIHNQPENTHPYTKWNIIYITTTAEISLCFPTFLPFIEFHSKLSKDFVTCNFWKRSGLLKVSHYYLCWKNYRRHGKRIHLDLKKILKDATFFPEEVDNNQAFGEEIVFSREQYGFHSLRQEDSWNVWYIEIHGKIAKQMLGGSMQYFRDRLIHKTNLISWSKTGQDMNFKLIIIPESQRMTTLAEWFWSRNYGNSNPIYQRRKDLLPQQGNILATRGTVLTETK